jgi:hypothetical protein
MENSMPSQEDIQPKKKDSTGLIVIKGFPQSLKNQLHLMLIGTDYYPADAFKLLVAEFVFRNLKSSQNIINKELTSILKRKFKKPSIYSAEFNEMVMSIANRKSTGNQGVGLEQKGNVYILPEKKKGFKKLFGGK